jgi:hypothetical protein
VCLGPDLGSKRAYREFFNSLSPSRGHLQGETCLARTAYAGESQEPRHCQLTFDLFDFSLTPYETAPGGGQIVSRGAGRFVCSTGVQRVSFWLPGHLLCRKKPVALRSCLEAGLHSPRGACAPTRHHCSNRSNASSRDAQEHVAAYSQKKRSQELFPQRIGRPRITEIGRGVFARCAGKTISLLILKTYPHPRFAN